MNKLILTMCGVFMALATASCGNYPTPIESAWDIRMAKQGITDITIRRLPLEDYPRLAKFPKLKSVGLENITGAEGATDAKLQALAHLPFTNLTGISMLNSRAVTDRGIAALTTFSSLRQLQLEGTSITDEACNIMTRQMHFSGRNSGINVANCPGITFKGLQLLATSDMEGIGFSIENLSGPQVIELIESMNKITWCEIVDTQRTLDAETIKARGLTNGVKVVVLPKGALQLIPNR